MLADGPMCSFNVWKTFGKVITGFNWKGLHVFRLRVSPAQPRTAAVMNVRIKMLVLGKVSKIFSATSTLMADIKLKTPARKPWNGWWVGVAIKQFQKDNDAYDVLEADYIANDSSVAHWNDSAIGLGLAAHTLVVNGGAADHPAEYPPGLAAYSLAKAMWYMEVLDESDVAYTDPHTWLDAAVTTFLARIGD